ncbi:MAG: DMT family transporter [Chloroflexales bacterium]|nr:DMT family transporter [Chloroflexales bacterium]
MTGNENPRLAIAVIIGTVFALALGDALIKDASATFTLWQIFVLRSVAVVPILILLIRGRAVGVQLVPEDPFWTVVRSSLLTLMWITYYLSLAHVELSIAAAAYYTLPLFITLFAATFLGDSIGSIGWFAVVMGFAGVVLILEPRVSDFNWYAVLPLVSAVLYALAMILTRSRCRREHMFVLSLWLNLTMLAAGATATLVLVALELPLAMVAAQEFLLGSWSTLGFNEWAALAVLSATMIIGSVGAAYAYQNGRPSTIATFDFAYVAFAMAWGMIVFGEEPTSKGVAGVTLIVVAGILAVRSSNRRAQAAEQGVAADVPPASRLGRG